MAKHIVDGHRMRKRFGQNFLSDPNIISQITFAIRPKEGQHIVEIGPGQGAITEDMVASGATVTAIELDRDLIPWLKVKFERNANFSILNQDALKTDYAEIAAGKQVRVVGNLPYNISTPIIFHLLEQAEHIEDMHFMLQKEVVDRMAAGPGDNNYGRLSVMTQYGCEVDGLFVVPPESFNPPPKVDSAIVRLRPRKEKLALDSHEYFEHIVREAFSQRRKTLKNTLKKIIKPLGQPDLGVDLSLRPENLSVEDYVNISNTLYRLSK
ncbi:MAG: 16S rRNA (adenine(1518)-N(6)/adenine(1519)-N(6))-dimethyltransferase RsmA [Gammaproteobacteria bacterium]|nr:16S rRNA (adenine(1518)-N(6)/adenine(1519)-N(6))-dimethyltransferase RsmA [Gammaproteobacteria bacterium]